MIRVGLTGSIGMGKSSAAAAFASLGVPVHSADEAVHRLYAGRAAPEVERLFPGTVRDGVVDRAALAARILPDPEARHALEALVHPMVREEEAAFLAAAEASGAAMAVLDVPLLFETGRDNAVDVVLVVSAGEGEQRRRVLARPGMTQEKFEAIRAAQMPDAEKRARATHVIDTSGPIEATRAAIAGLHRELLAAGQNEKRTI